MSHAPGSPLVLRRADVVPVDRGTGVRSLPLVGKWNVDGNKVTTGITAFAPGTSIPLHTHNVEEAVIVLAGTAKAIVGDESFDLLAGDVTWVPAGIPHCFRNVGGDEMRIYWVYGGRDVTRTICATGKTIEHLSPDDRAASPDTG